MKEEPRYVDNTKTITHVSLCAGYAGLDRGIARAIPTARTIAFCEIEGFAVANLVAKMEAGALDPVPVRPNLKTFPWEQFRGNVDLVSGGFPCFVEGTLVLTKHAGYLPIEQVRVGDLVLTHLGNWKPVTAAMRKCGATTTKVNPTLGFETECTSEHPYYARFRVPGCPRSFLPPTWLEADRLTKHWRLGNVLPSERTTDHHSEAFWWVVGRYVADGWRAVSRGKGRVVISAGEGKVEACIERIEAAGFNACLSREETCDRIHITRQWFHDWLEPFGDGCEGKRIPGWVLGLPLPKLRAFVEGYLAGDGHRDNGKHVFVSVAKQIILGMALAARRVFGTSVSVHTIKRPPTCVIQGRTVNQQDFHRGVVNKTNHRGFVEGKYSWGELRRGKGGTNRVVHNLAVQDDESYLANGVIVHNCQPFSHAGKRIGDEDPRHLFPYILNGIKVCRPSAVFLENVEGIVSAKLAGDHWADPAGTPVLLHVLRELERAGYSCAWGLFSAAEVGAPHQRKRVFILGLEHTASFDSWGLPLGAEPQLPVAGEPGELVHAGLLGPQVGGLPSAGPLEPSGGLVGGQGPDRWPARPNQPQHAWEPPRVVSKGDLLRGKLEALELVDSDCRGLEGAGQEGRLGADAVRPGDQVRGEGATQPAVGRTFDGTPHRLDPSVRVDSRVDELRLLGNGVVPATAAKAFLTLFGRLTAGRAAAAAELARAA